MSHEQTTREADLAAAAALLQTANALNDSLPEALRLSPSPAEVDTLDTVALLGRRLLDWAKAARAALAERAADWLNQREKLDQPLETWLAADSDHQATLARRTDAIANRRLLEADLGGRRRPLLFGRAAFDAQTDRLEHELRQAVELENASIAAVEAAARAVEERRLRTRQARPEILRAIEQERHHLEHLRRLEAMVATALMHRLAAEIVFVGDGWVTEAMKTGDIDTLARAAGRVVEIAQAGLFELPVQVGARLTDVATESGELFFKLLVVYGRLGRLGSACGNWDQEVVAGSGRTAWLEVQVFEPFLRAIHAPGFMSALLDRLPHPDVLTHLADLLCVAQNNGFVGGGRNALVVLGALRKWAMQHGYQDVAMKAGIHSKRILNDLQANRKGPPDHTYIEHVLQTTEEHVSASTMPSSPTHRSAMLAASRMLEQLLQG